MIPVRIDKDPEVPDNFSHLGRYVAAAKEKGEKLDKFWISNCDAGAKLDDLETALIEIEATRLMKREIADKTYHLVVSFRPGEQEKLSLADLQDIERNFAEALGYGDHQRVAGTHINTDNFHMHIAINKVHPKTFKVHTPRRDFATLERVARAMEQKYGLHVDRGKNSPAQERLSPKAKDFEAKTWQQSFESHLLEHKAEIMAAITSAKDWQQVHRELAEFDAQLKKRGAGLAFVQIGGKGAAKASALDRDCSLTAMEKRLGPYQPLLERKVERATSAQAPKSQHRPKRPYQAKPLTRHPGTARLWRNYRQEKPSTFLKRHLFSMRSWRDYLLADAHKDPLALVTIITYKELLYTIEEALTPRRAPYRPYRSISPALNAWYAASPWKQPSVAGLQKTDVAALGLKTDDAGRVIFPYRDRDGHVWAVRALDADGKTLDVGDPAGRPDLAHVIDPQGHLAKPYDGRIVLTTDCVAGASIHAGTGAPAVIVGKEADLPTWARSIRLDHPGCKIVVAATEISRAATVAAKAANGELVTASRQDQLARWIMEQVGKGKAVPVEPEIAGTMGAFIETALSPEEAKASQPQRGKTSKRGAVHGR